MMRSFAVENLLELNARQDFPILQQQNRGKPLIYLDTASSAQKPQQVITAINNFYLHDYANIHRGIYELSERATSLYEKTRDQVKNFIHANCIDEIIFTHGTTDAINLLANSLSQSWQAGDEVILSQMEHHSNIVPWLILKEKMGLVIKVIPIKDDGSLDIDVYQQLFSSRTKLVAITHASNVMGTINPVKMLTEISHAHHVPILLDGAQAIAHMPVNVKDIDCDFYVFSAHKLYGPTGIGVLYAKQFLLEKLPVYQGGGGMIATVSFSSATFTKSPQKFEAGTPNIAGVIGLSAAIKYVEDIGMNNIYSHEQTLLAYALEKFLQIPELKMIGTAKPKLGVISFVMDNIHPHDMGTVMDCEGIAIRAGHHCAMPLMERFNVPATVRVSLGIYNNEEDINCAVKAILLAKEVLS